MFIQGKYPIVKDCSGCPYYVQWGIWCWRQPSYIGLPLLPLALPLLIFDIVYILGYGLYHWGGRSRKVKEPGGKGSGR